MANFAACAITMKIKLPGVWTVVICVTQAWLASLPVFNAAIQRVALVTNKRLRAGRPNKFNSHLFKVWIKVQDIGEHGTRGVCYAIAVETP